MSDILPFLITGVVTGSIYGLAGLGLVLTFRTSGVFNFGHGAIGAAAAALFYTLHVTHGMAWPLAAAITLALFAVVVGWMMERVTRGLGDVPEAVVVLATVGIFIGVQGLLTLQYGPVTRDFPQFLPRSGFSVAGVFISWAQVIGFAASLLAVLVLYTFLRRTRLGVSMRAVVDNPTLVSLSGDSPVRVRQAAWTIGSGFAALSGVLLAPTLGLDPAILSFLVVQAFGACAIGLFKSLPLTYAGGIGIGVLASLATKYFTKAPFSGVPASVPFIVLFAVLLFIPASRLPTRRTSPRALVPDAPPTSRRVGLALGIGGAVGMLVVPHVVGAYLPVWTATLINVIVFASLALLVWTSGQISLCHAAFLAVGASAMGHFTTGLHLPWLVALLLAGLVTIPVGAIVAIPAIRVSGLYLALSTFGFGVLMQYVVYPTGLMFTKRVTVFATRPHFLGFDGHEESQYYYLVLGLACLSLFVITCLVRSSLGRVLRGMSETPTMLVTHGLDVNRTRLLVFCISAFFAGIAGALGISQFGAASGLGYGPAQSLLLLAVLAICGTRLLRSSILAAGLLTIGPAYFTSFGVDRQTFAFGFVAVLAAIVVARRVEFLEFVARPGRVRRSGSRSAHPRPAPTRAPGIEARMAVRSTR